MAHAKTRAPWLIRFVARLGWALRPARTPSRGRSQPSAIGCADVADASASLRIGCTILASLIVLLLALSSATPADAVEGVYRNAMTKAAILRRAKGFAISFETGARRCGGAIKGTGQRRHNDILFHGRSTIARDAPVCRMTITPVRNKLHVREGLGCTYYHGAACEFEGILTKRSRLEPWKRPSNPLKRYGGCNATVH